MYIMNKIKYLPTDYSSNKDVIKTSWSIDPEMTEIFGYQPRLRNSIVFTQESSSGTTTDSAQEAESKQETNTKPKQETYTKPAQNSVWAKVVSKPAEVVSKPATTTVPDLATLIPVLPTSKKSESKIRTTKNKFNDFQQRNYSDDEIADLEKKLLSK